MTQNRIPWYSNGNCPTSRLIVFNRGFTAGEGDWEHRLPRATLRRWRSLVARAYRRTGRILTISTGWGTDRPYNIQVMAKQKYGKYAATPGYSSHGMVFEGQQTAAIDASNWSWVYDGNYAAWQQDVAAEGFTRLPNGYQQEGEYHHIIDWNPWDDEPEFGGAPAFDSATDFTSEPEAEQEEEDDMKAIQLNDTDGSGVIIQAATPPYSYDRQVFNALVGAYNLKPVTLPDWQYATAIREQWTSAKVSASLKPGADIPAEDIATIIAGVKAGIDSAISQGLGVDEIIARLDQLPAETAAAVRAKFAAEPLK